MRLAITAAAVAAIGAIVLAGVAALGVDRPSPHPVAEAQLTCRTRTTTSDGRCAPRSEATSMVASAHGETRGLAFGPDGDFAYVDDRRGADVLKASVGGKVIKLDTRGEVSNPSWSHDGKLAWAENLSTLAVWDPAADKINRTPGPGGGIALFSPVFSSDSTIAAVVQEPSKGISADEDGLNNLYGYLPSDGSWTQLTHFAVTGDRWSVIRTPLHRDGSIYFVRVAGRASATGPPRFELWRLRDGQARRLRVLPGEMYIAGWAEGSLEWNAHTSACGGEWGVFAGSLGDLHRVGCGAILADPLTGIDPDLAHGHHSHPVSRHRTRAHLAVVVGDFQTAEQAERMAATLPDSFFATVVGHAAAPGAVKPGAWIVSVPVPAGTTPSEMQRRVGGYIRDPGIEAFLTSLGSRG